MTGPGPAAPDDLGHRLVLVVGARRSGTNWVGRTIAAHPEVTALANETYLFHALNELTERFQHGAKGSWQLATLYVERARLVHGLRQLCDTVLAPHLEGTAPGHRLLERTPDHVRNLQLIGEIYPEARVVHIVRDGRDVARSLVSMPWGPDSLADAAHEWATAVGAGQRAIAHLRHYCEVRYEDLLADPRRGFAALYGALGLDAGNELIDAALREAGVPYNHDPAMPVIETGKWRSTLDADEVATIESVAGEILRSSGYGLDAGGVAPTRRQQDRARRQIERWAGIARSRLRSRGAPRVESSRADDLHRAQRVVDAFLGALATGNRDDALATLADDAMVRTFRGTERWEERGAAAGHRFVAALLADPVLDGPQIASDVHPAPGAVTVVVAGEVDGQIRHGTLVLHVTDGRITRATWSTDS